LFKTKRLAHQEAVKRIINLNNSNKQSEMIQMLMKKMFEMLIASITNLAKEQSNMQKNLEMIQYNKDLMNGLF
jgi:hypothetical protein